MTLLEKQKFFSLYFGQKVMKESVPGLENFKTEPDGFIRGMGDESKLYLELKSLSNISDEDAIEVFLLIFGSLRKENRTQQIDFGKGWAKAYNYFNYGSGHYGTETGNVIDFLRSKSYSLPYLSYSVEDLIKEGIIKLI